MGVLYAKLRLLPRIIWNGHIYFSIFSIFSIIININIIIIVIIIIIFLFLFTLL